ncbi:hypothetical protein CR513_49034, partial [Mucuna pruriens]
MCKINSFDSGIYHSMCDCAMSEKKNYLPFPELIVKAQKTAIAKDWESFKGIFRTNKKLLFEPFDLSGNTPIHVVARSGNEQLLKELLVMSKSENEDPLRKPNFEKNTILHEVVLLDDPKMVDVIMNFDKNMPYNNKESLLDLRNKSHETPAFKAAEFGKLRVLNHLHANYTIKSEHLTYSQFRGNRRPILHTCVLTFNFRTAIWLLEKFDKNLAQQKFERVDEEKNEEENTQKNEEENIKEENNEGVTCLKLLSNMSMAFKSTDTLKMGFTKTLIYKLLPEDGYESELEDGNSSVKVTRDEESNQSIDATKKIHKSKVGAVFSRVNYAFWKHAKGFGYICKIWDLKKKHKFAERLVELLLENENSWKECPSVPANEPVRIRYEFPSNVTKKKENLELKDRINRKKIIEDPKKHLDENTKAMWESPLFLAAATGIIEVVKLIVEKYPEAISHVNKDGLNILHVAVKHRKLNIYEYIEESPAFESLKPRITKTDKRTILHQAASMDYYREEALAGVAYQLQSELEWYKRVEETVPRHFLLHGDNDGLTAGDLLDIDHAMMHAEAKQWMKETAQSCSTVAVLIAGVVFAAAYAIPGGTEGGKPVLRNSSAFTIFTTMDVVALATSLGSVVMFLSILTSSFDLWDFHKSLPRKLRWGFIMLFFSLITTMLAFAATILLTIRMEGNKESTTLAYSLAFVVVSIFGLTQFPVEKMVRDQVQQCSKTWKSVKKWWLKSKNKNSFTLESVT